MRLRNTDAFAALNAVLFAILASTVYLQRFLRYRGPGNMDEFFIYACAIVLVILVVWVFLRRVDYPTWVLVLMQAGILSHFAGAFIPVDGGRLYDTAWAGLGYDKYVHVFNAFAGAAVLTTLFDRTGVQFAFRWLVIVMIVLGAGAVLEMVEYMVTLTVPNAGVGGYDNNMRDLIANAVGALGYIAAGWAVPRVFPRRSSAMTA